MWKAILFNIFISLTIIYLIHYLWDYFKNSWTIKKSKDLVNTHISKYKKIAEEAIDNNIKKDLIKNENKNLEKELEDYLISIYGDCENCDNNTSSSLSPIATNPLTDNIEIELMAPDIII